MTTAKKRGGPRPGGGRPPGSKNKSTLTKEANAVIQKKLEDAGVGSEGKGVKAKMVAHDGSEMPADYTPLQVMLAAMRKAWVLGGPLFAFSYAKEAAPFMHPKLGTVEAKAPATVAPDGTVVSTPLGAVAVRIDFVRPAPPPEAEVPSGS